MKRKETNKIKRLIALVLCFTMALSGNMMTASAANLGENGLRGDYYLLNSGDTPVRRNCNDCECEQW